MYIFLTVIAFLAAILLILIVVVQNSKGGGLASGFSASNQVMGVRKTTDFLEKMTWTLAGIVAILSIATAGFVKNNAEEKQSIIKTEVENAVAVDPNLVSPDFGTQGQATGATEAPAANE